MSDPREGSEFFLTEPAKLDDPFPDLAYFREHRPILYFRFDDVSALFHDARLSADRMKGFVDAAPAEVWEELRQIAPHFETWVLMKDGADHARMRKTLNLGFNPAQVHDLVEPIQQIVDELLDVVQGRGTWTRAEISRSCFPLTFFRISWAWRRRTAPRSCSGR
jgi:cytochrome P450